MSIGGNHFIHILRRNIDVNIIMFNNQIYGLTKGQYSPTSEQGKITRSTPQGSLYRPFNPIELALAEGATFIGRTIDRDPIHMLDIFKQAAAYKVTSFIEVYQNCNIFNDGAFFHLTDKSVKNENLIYLENSKPLSFGKYKDRGIAVEGNDVKLLNFKENGKKGNATIFHEDDPNSNLACILAQMTYISNLPTPIGVFRKIGVDVYEDLLERQIADEIDRHGRGDLEKLLHSGDVWKIE